MTENACPDAPTLAAFVEGALDTPQRAAVERHVANCPECPAIIGDVARFLADTDAEARAWRPSPRRWFVAAALAALCIPVAIWRTVAPLDPVERIRRVAAASPDRGYEGRLHGFAHAPFRAPRAGESRPLSISLQAESERLARRGADADTLHARGVATLIDGQRCEAVRLLKTAVDLDPRRAAAWNDLSVAELACARLRDRNGYLAALQAADRAIELAPMTPDSHYNRGIALEHLGRDAEATVAYRQALHYETSPSWRREIHGRLNRLQPAR